MRIHEYLEIVTKADGEKIIVCRKCGHEFCQANQNYKRHALYLERTLQDWPQRRPASGEDMFVVYQEYVCPGCGVLLEVDNYCPALDSEDEKILWDMQLS